MRKACYLIPIMALTLFSCSSQENSSISNSNTSDSTNDYSTNTIEVAKSLDLIQVEGRLEVLSDGIAIDYSGSAITFKANCKGTVSASITCVSLSRNFFETSRPFISGKSISIKTISNSPWYSSKKVIPLVKNFTSKLILFPSWYLAIYSLNREASLLESSTTAM